MHERPDESRQVVEFARMEASALDVDYVGTEHLLLGLLREEGGVAGRALETLGVTLDEVRLRAKEIRPPRGLIPGDRMPLTPRSKRVLELASEEALEQGSDQVSTRHILLALVRGDGGPGARILRDLGIGADRVEDAVDEISS